MLNTDIENADFKLTIEVSLRAIAYGTGRRTGGKEKRAHVRNIRAPARISAL